MSYRERPLLRFYQFNCDRRILSLTLLDGFVCLFLSRLERWQNERLSPRKLGGRLEPEDIPIQSSNIRSVASQTVWLKFEAEKNPRDAAYQLIRLRRKLGLPTHVPIHGPGGQQALQQHLKNAENEQVSLIIVAKRQL